MRIISAILTTALMLLFTSPAPAETYPLDYWAVREAMRNVELSPNGQYIAFMEISSKSGNPVLKVFETSNLGKTPYSAGGESLEIYDFSWISETDIIITFRDQVRDRIDDFNQGVYEYKIALLNVEKRTFKQVDDNRVGLGVKSSTATSVNLENVLPNEPNKVLISYSEFNRERSRRAISYYKLDLKTFNKNLILKGNYDVYDVEFDDNGNPRQAKLNLISDKLYLTTLYRKPGEKEWRRIFYKDEDSFETFQVAGYVKDDPSVVFVRANNGHDKVGLWKFNVDTKQFSELVYRNDEVDVTGLVRHSNYWEQPETIIGVGYNKDKRYRHYFDTDDSLIEEATLNQLEGLTPGAYDTRIISRSRDGNTLVIYNTGPRDPGSYYLFAAGRFQYLGGQKPLLEAEYLADVRYIQYRARDGRMIPGFVTVPNGDGPFPLVVLPHGGPFVSETIVFDEWSQLLANNGYMVLQPQYRGSRGYGLDFYTTAFINGGQGGYAMQDDKDDGALHLVREGLVDPDRIAMFGWSYGGYAALIAAARDDQIYQCAIAGAAVADNIQQFNYYRDDVRGASETEQLRFWEDSVNPIKNAAKVNIPLLIIHGDVDQRVPVKHARRYKKALDSAGIDYSYVELEDADHFFDTLFYRHKIKIYEGMIDFFKNDCGPGGL